MAWTIYNDRRTTTPAPPPEVVARRVRTELTTIDTTPSAERDHIFDVIIDEIIKDTDK